MNRQPMPMKSSTMRHFQNDDEPVDESRFFGAANEQQREQEQNENARDVHDAVHAAGVVFEWRMRPLIWDRAC